MLFLTAEQNVKHKRLRLLSQKEMNVQCHQNCLSLSHSLSLSLILFVLRQRVGAQDVVMCLSRACCRCSLSLVVAGSLHSTDYRGVLEQWRDVPVEHSVGVV